MISPERAICGLATVFGQPSRNGDDAWQADQFSTFLDLQLAVPLRFNHSAMYFHWGVLDKIGTARLFAPVAYPAPGLLMLGEIDKGPVGDSILSDIQAILSQQWLPSAWSFSVGGLKGEDGQILIQEVSITQSPAFDDARLLAAGPGAVDGWSLLTKPAAPARGGDS